MEHEIRKGGRLCGDRWKSRVGGEHPVVWTEVEMQSRTREIQITLETSVTSIR